MAHPRPRSPSHLSTSATGGPVWDSETLSALEKWGLLPWDVSEQNISQKKYESNDQSAQWSQDAAPTDLPCLSGDLPETAWHTLSTVARWAPPPAAWQATALKRWLDETRTGILTAGPDAVDRWKMGWERWAGVARWRHWGMPRDVVDVLAVTDVLDLPVELLEPVVACLEAWGALTPVLERSINRALATNGAPSLWSRLCCGSERLQGFALSHLALQQAGWHQVFWTEVYPLTRNEEDLWTLLHRQAFQLWPQWGVQYGPTVLQECLRQAHVVAAQALLNHGVIPLPQWRDWARGVGTGMRLCRRPPSWHPDLFTRGCLWIDVAVKLNQLGVAWEADEASCRPLSRVIEDPNGRDAWACATLLSAGAPPDSAFAPPVEVTTPSAQLWRAALDRQALATALGSASVAAHRSRL